MSGNSDKQKIKRGPGRPCIDNKNRNIIPLGICNTPENTDNLIEFKFNNPNVFKRIFTLFKAHNVSEIQLIFDRENITMLGESYSKECNFRLVVDCKAVYRYYCLRPICLLINRALMGLIIDKIDANFYSDIQFTVSNYNEIIRSMTISLFNSNLNSVANHMLNLSSMPIINITDSWNKEYYRLSFQFNKKNFKKIINDIESVSNKFIIEKVAGSYPLVFKYTKDCNVIEVVESYDPNKIDLESKMLEFEIIAATLKVVNIKSIANAQIGPFVKLYIDNEKKLLIAFDLEDSVIDFRALIDIEDYKTVD
jgi:hypothetical protein